MEPKLTPLSKQDTFRFECSPNVPCFNECCRDLNQFLTPYDILRLKNHFGLTSGEFLEQYTTQHVGPESGLPVVTLRPKGGHDLICPFVSPGGCTVYDNRPSSCRTYPLVRALSRSRQTGEITEQFMVLQEAHCLGFREHGKQTVRQWIDDQEIAIYNEINDKLMQIISLKNQLMPGKGSKYKDKTGNEAMLNWLKDNNAKGNVTIHTFLFGKDKVATKTMKAIATQHGGKFKAISLDD